MAKQLINKKNGAGPTHGSPRPVLVVGVGASAGGLDAFSEFLSNTPTDTGMAFVLLPHLDPTRKSMMKELLTQKTSLPISVVEEGQPLAADHVYILQPAHGLTTVSGKLHLAAPLQPKHQWNVIDQFLRSLAADQQERSVGIILSGTGQHGILGLNEIKLAGGLVIAQSPDGCAYPEMPQTAIDAGMVDLVLPVAEMPAALLKYANYRYLANQPKEEDISPELVDSILNLLRTHSRFDFRRYRKNMLVRRILRRMALCHVYSLEDYKQCLRDDQLEMDALIRDLLIGVTTFFRDPAAFEVLQQQILPALVDRAGADVTVRVWVPACSTGEEAYTLGILLLEAFTAAGKMPNVQIFASDVNEHALTVARKGIYAGNSIKGLSAQRIERFFVKLEGEAYQVNQRLRDILVFASQNVIGDPPFSLLDLISCRNLLIYLQPDVQSRLIQLFHFALNANGHLLLGPSESIGRYGELFAVVSKQWRIFKRLPFAERRHLIDIPLGISPLRRFQGRIGASDAPGAERNSYAELTFKTLLADYAPASVLINKHYDILQFYGPTSNYLELPSGEPSLNLMAMLRRGLSSRVRALAAQVLKEQQTIVDPHARVQRDGRYYGCRLVARPILAADSNTLLLLSFEDCALATTSNAATLGAELPPEDLRLIEQLEYELKATREDQQGNLEALKNSNEELIVANEEMMSINEEMQSANEELETSKEELQSMNEELSTVNAELQSKVEELEASNDDIVNLLASTDIATLFLDCAMHIKLFNPAMAELMNLRRGDISRPISDISGKVQGDEFDTDAHLVLETLKRIERVVNSNGGANARSYLRRMVPYQASNNRIGGVVVTFVDITERYRQEKQLGELVEMRAVELQRSQKQLSVVLQAAGGAVWEMDSERNLELVSPEIHGSMFGELPTAVEKNWDWWLDRVHPEERADVDLSLQSALEHDDDNWEHIYRFRMATGHYHWIWDIAHISRDSAGVWQRITGAMIDVNERREMALEAHSRGERMAAIMAHTSDAVLVYDQAGVMTECNPVAERMFGYKMHELVGGSVVQLIPPSQRQIYEKVFSSNRPFRMLKLALGQQQLLAQHKSGRTFPVEIRVSAIASLGLVVCVVHDLSDQFALQQKVSEVSTSELESFGHELHDSLGQRLTGLLMITTHFRSQLDRCEPPQAQMLDDIVEQLKEAAREVNRLSRGLAPISVSPRGLADALASLVERMDAAGPTRCIFRSQTGISVAHPTVARQVYRIAQEALNNALKYANGETISISLERTNGQVELIVQDDGVGFDMGASRHLEGLGLRIMRSRANMIGAVLSVDSVPGEGTRIKCTFTLQDFPDGSARKSSV